MSTAIPEDLPTDNNSTDNLLFDNPAVNMAALPDTENISYQRLDPGYMSVMFIRTNLLYLVITVPILITLFVKNDFSLQIWVYIVVGWFLLWVLSNVLVPFKFRKKGYALRQHDVIYRSGLWWRKKVIVPFNRIQHCEVKQGPFSKIFGIKSLTVYTAGGGSSDLKVSGLPEQNAEQVKEFVLRRITSEDDGE